MAEIEYGSFDAGHGRGAAAPAKVSPVFKAINWMGGVTSLAMIAGLGYWGYSLMMRDVTGVPVVRAMEGPFREAPEDPGGKLAEHQGLSVNEVTGTGAAGELPPAIRLAPDAMDLDDEDLPVGELAEIIPATYADPEPDIDTAWGEVDDMPEDALATDVAVAEALASTGDPAEQAQALADALTRGVQPLSSLTADDDGIDTFDLEETEVAPELPQITRGALEGLISSPRPPVRPAGLGIQVASASPASTRRPSRR